MNVRWAVHIENFAKISSADVGITPLMCFVGDNNSGKSYLMSLLWGILTLGKELFPKSSSGSPIYRKCEKWLRDNVNNTVEIDDEIIDLYIQWFNELLNNNKKVFLQRIFNYTVDAEKIEIRSYHRTNKLKLQWEQEGERYSVTESYIRFPRQKVFTKEILLRMNSYICWNILMHGIAAPLYTPVVKGRRMGEPVYLPASRTGFMLTYPQLIEHSLQVSFAPEFADNSSSLTQPYVDFLQLITKFESKSRMKKEYKWVVDYIETNLTKGNLKVVKDAIPVIKYYPEGTQKEIPLYVASSIVAEVSPLLLLFKSDIKFNTLIIEEPEAHLHPELQQKMARLIVNLVNRNIPVWITTHSDTILQHINNMIKLSNHESRMSLMDEFGYKKEDLLSKDNVSMYQFKQLPQGKSELETLKTGKYGFVVPTFNDALEQIVKEVYAFQED